MDWKKWLNELIDLFDNQNKMITNTEFFRDDFNQGLTPTEAFKKHNESLS